MGRGQAAGGRLFLFWLLLWCRQLLLEGWAHGQLQEGLPCLGCRPFAAAIFGFRKQASCRVAVPPQQRCRPLRLGLSSACRYACRLLFAALQEDWFGDPNAVRQKVGLIDEQPSTSRKEASGRRWGAWAELACQRWLLGTLCTCDAPQIWLSEQQAICCASEARTVCLRAALCSAASLARVSQWP